MIWTRVMNKKAVDQAGAEDLTFEVSDEALEAEAENEAGTLAPTFTTPHVQACCTGIEN
jgi:hypothetical protein